MVLHFLDSLPVWLMALAICGGSVLATTAVQLVLHQRWSVEARRPLNEIAGFIIAVVGVVYAVLLASIAILAIERYDRAEQVSQTEAGLVSDLYRDASGLAEPLRSDVRATLMDYLTTVIDVEWPIMEANDVGPAGWQGHGWSDLTRLLDGFARYEPQTSGQTVFMQEMLGRINDLNDARRLRMFAAGNALDGVIWWVVIAGGIGTVAMALLFGVSSPGHIVISNLLAFSISLVIVLIVSMDRPFTGQPSVTPEPFRYVKEKLQTLHLESGFPPDPAAGRLAQR